MSNSGIVIKNSLISMIAQICSMIIGFICHRFFLMYLGVEKVGINSVITETLGFLAFAELGVGTAISYRLYKPLVDRDIKRLSILMQLYKKVYSIIGIAVWILGLVLMCFLPIFINDASSDMFYIRTAYLIQLLATSSSYFFAYKRALIFVDQKQFVCKIVDIVCNIVFSIFRIIALIIFKNFHIYLVLQLIQTLVGNIILGYYCDKNYSFIKVKTKDKFEDVKGMFQDTKDVLFGKVAGYVYSSTDNLVISTFSGIALAGGFSTYKYVTNAIKNLTYSMTDSIVATIGNNIQHRDAEDNYVLFQKYTFIRYVVANIAITGMCISADAFVGFAFGKQYIMHWSILYLIACDIFIGIVYGPLGEYITVLGYFKYEKYINIIGAGINIGLSILLVQQWGVTGVLIGTVVSQCFFWVAKSILLYWKYFESPKRWLDMWKKYIRYTFLVIIQIMILHILKQQIVGENYNFFLFFVEAIVSVAVSVLAIILCFRKTKEYDYLVSIIKKILKRMTGIKM